LPKKNSKWPDSTTLKHLNYFLVKNYLGLRRMCAESPFGTRNHRSQGQEIRRHDPVFLLIQQSIYMYSTHNFPFCLPAVLSWHLILFYFCYSNCRSPNQEHIHIICFPIDISDEL
jgi:hypothetical protein